MSRDSEDKPRDVDFEVASIHDDSASPPEPAVRQLARDAVAEIEPRLRSLVPQPIANELGHGLNVADAARRLQWSEDRVRAAIAGAELLAHQDGDGELAIPEFQLVGHPAEIAEGVTIVLGQLEPVCVDRRTLVAWFCAPKDELNGATPAAWISDGCPADALELAAKRDVERLG
jgi:hypothetical protein